MIPDMFGGENKRKMKREKGEGKKGNQGPLMGIPYREGGIYDAQQHCVFKEKIDR